MRRKISTAGAATCLPRQFTEPKGWELQNMLTIARLMIRAALEREETRGVHVRTDFPNADDDHWQRHLAFRSDLREVGSTPAIVSKA